MTETKIKVRTTLGVTDHNLLDNRFIDNQHTINAISGLEEALGSKQNVLTAGENIEISEEGEISAVDTTYTAGENVSISEENVISATDTTYTAGTNVSIDNGVISAVDTTYTAGTGIDITNGVISNTQTSAEWGNVTGNLNDQTDLKNALDAKANSSDLATVATSGSYADLSNKPTIADGILTIQKNGTTVDTFTANSSDNKTVNLVIPTTAADVSAMPDSVKYGASITVAIDSSNYQVTTTLKDQDGNTLGTAQVIDLPLESVVVSGSYDDVNKNVVLTLQNGSTITFSLADLVSGLQSEITSQNKLDADLVDDSTSVNKFVTASDKTTWDGKQDAISDLATIRAGANAGATAVQAGDLATVATTGNYADLSGTPTIPTVNNPQITITQGGVTKGSFTLNQTSGDTIALDAGGGSSSYDDETINENASNQLQAIGLKEARTDTAIRLWHGTEQQWEEGASQTWYNWGEANIPAAWSFIEYTSLPNTNIWSYVAYGNNKFVAVPGLSFNDVVAISADDGETWSSSSLPTGHSTRWNAIAFGSNNFVTLGYNSNVAAYSSDGSTWTDVTLPSTERWTGIAYGGGRFVAVSSQMTVNTSAVYSTNDGTSWTASNSKFGNDWGVNTMCSLVYGNNMFLAIGGINTASDKIAYSTDGGETWRGGIISSSQTWMRAAYGNGKFVAVAKGTDTYAYSSDGLTWTESTLPSSANWMSITFGNGYFVAVADNGKYAYSPDGENWEENTFTSSGWFDVAFGNNKYVSITKETYKVSKLFGKPDKYYTIESEPTLNSIVYSEPNVVSALTITATGTGTITLSNTKTYSYNSSGNETTYRSIGEVYPNYLCLINGVGIKIGTTSIVTVDQTYNASSTNAQSGVAVDSVVGNIETALQEV